MSFSRLLQSVSLPHTLRSSLLTAFLAVVLFAPFAQAHDGAGHGAKAKGPFANLPSSPFTSPLDQSQVPTQNQPPSDSDQRSGNSKSDSAAQQRAQAGPPGGEFKFVTGLGPARLSSDGSDLEVQTANGITQTHGTDTEEELNSNVNSNYPSLGTLQSPSCYSSGGQFRLVYMHAADAPNRWSSTMTDYMRTGMKKANTFLRNTAISNNGKSVSLRAKCYSTGTMEVLNFGRSSGTVQGATFTSVANEVRARYNNSKYKYIVLFDNDVCKKDSVGNCQSGVGNGWRTDATRSTSNSNNQPNTNYSSSIAVVWQKKYFSTEGTTTLHEMLHGMGAVNSNAPQATGNGHCWDDLDTMCYDDKGTKAPGAVWRRCSTIQVDCGGDTYFRNGATSGFLASNWQIAYSGNRFMSFSG